VGKYFLVGIFERKVDWSPTPKKRRLLVKKIGQKLYLNGEKLFSLIRGQKHYLIAV